MTAIAIINSTPSFFYSSHSSPFFSFPNFFFNFLLLFLLILVQRIITCWVDGPLRAWEVALLALKARATQSQFAAKLVGQDVAAERGRVGLQVHWPHCQPRQRGQAKGNRVQKHQPRGGAEPRHEKGSMKQKRGKKGKRERKTKNKNKTPNLIP
jgi:hypothetical protein